MNQALETYRKQIDELDEELLVILAKRFKIVEEIGRFKARHQIKLMDQKRWNELLAARIQSAVKLKLPKSFIEKLFAVLHTFALEIEEKS